MPGAPPFLPRDLGVLSLCSLFSLLSKRSRCRGGLHGEAGTKQRAQVSLAAAPALGFSFFGLTVSRDWKGSSFIFVKCRSSALRALALSGPYTAADGPADPL